MSFQQGLSGLTATSKQLGVIGNNIANANTYGAKASRAQFSDVYAGMAGGATPVGIGVELSSVSQQFTQGNISTTESPLDMAISGEGFFQLGDRGTTVYSRDGEFQLDRNGNIVNSRGQQLMGYAATPDGTIIPSTMQPLSLPQGAMAPAATSKVALGMNLDSRGPVTQPAGSPAIDFSDPTTYNSATQATVYDVKGQQIGLTWYFQKTGADSWNVYAVANGRSIKDTVGDGSGDPQRVASLTFSSDGTKITSTTPAPVTIDVPSVSLGQGAMSEAITGLALDFKGSTQFGSAFAVSNLAQDGYAPGDMVSVNVDQAGIVSAKYSNNQTRAAGQVVLARFRNPQGLAPLGGNAWGVTVASGNPIGGVPGDAGYGALRSGALEESNVDVTAELVAMITTQRAYQANAQTIKTEDQVVQTLLNLR